MVAAQAVEQSLAYLSDEPAVEAAMLAFAQEQTPYLQYLRTDGFALLTPDERDYLQYLALVLHVAATRSSEHAVPTVSGERIEHWDEQCWSWMQANVGRPMAERLTVFFDNVDQEELLAFAEDSLVDPDRDEEAADAADGQHLLTSGASRELAFVALAVLVAGLDEVL